MEMFLLEDGALLLNEVAPRPHNSGHYTIEACAISQYEQHLRAVMGWPLGDTSLAVGAWCAHASRKTVAPCSLLLRSLTMCRHLSVHVHGNHISQQLRTNLPLASAKVGFAVMGLSFSSTHCYAKCCGFA